MSFLEAILNLAGLLLFLKWRTVRVSSPPLPGKSLLALLRPTEKPRGQPSVLLFLAGLILVRAFFYWQIGAPLRWTPTLAAGIMPIKFRSDYLWLMFLYSLLSFLRALTSVYLGLALLSVINRRGSDSDPIQQWVRLQLGWFDHLPIAVKLILPPLLVAVGWLGLHPLMNYLALVPTSRSFAHVAEVAAVVGGSSLFAWEWLIIGLLTLHLLNSYIYFGNHALWNFVSLTARNALGPLEKLPLRAGRIDLAPLIGIGLILLAGWGWMEVLTRFYKALPL